MRKYYHNVLKGKPFSTRSVGTQQAHWVLFEALIHGATGHLEWDLICILKSCILSRNGLRLLDTIKDLDSRLLTYGDATSVATVTVHRLVACFLKKFPFDQSECNLSRTEAAKKKFLAAEEQCRLTNCRLRSLERGELPRSILAAREIIHDLLGPLTPKVIMRILGAGKHGPGATRSSTGNRVTPYYKYMDFPYTCTRSALPYAYAAISLDKAWLEILESSGRRRVIPTHGTPTYQKELQILSDCVEIEDSDKVTMVPKDARTDRPIAVGSSMNMYLQLGVKNFLEAKLAEAGIDLRSQARNQRYAHLGSAYHMSGLDDNPSQFSTIDLASASDTISYELVKLLLPSDWFAFLCDLRHETGMLEGELIRYEKFSAMGNGFTFPLETLIFWACCKATIEGCGHDASANNLTVYGDDIICRYSVAEPVIETLQWAGFSVNTDKSFLKGPFKESCGSDYFRGHDVRPFYLKRRLSGYRDVYFVCNSIAERATHLCQGARAALSAVYIAAVGLIPPADRRFIPLSVSDDCGLQVPELYMRRRFGGLQYLSDSELNAFKQRGWDFPNGSLDPVYIRETVHPREYRGRAATCLYLCLRENSSFHTVPHPHMKVGDFEVIECTKSGKVTRRDSYHISSRVLPCSNWDGMYSNHQLRGHLVWALPN